MLFRNKNVIEAQRIHSQKLSNGDYNTIRIFLKSKYSFAARMKVIEEAPHQFQLRNNLFFTKLLPNKETQVIYELRPTKRGEYQFGRINCYAQSPIALVSRRFIFDQSMKIPVYPSIIQLKKYELRAISHNLKELGIKKIRKLGHSLEFEQIKEYVKGDDFRTINWKATARKAQLMVNQYQDEKSQQVYSIIDKGRMMKMPFEQLSLLDYSINSSLVISNVAIGKQDKAGIITFSDRLGTMLPATKKAGQMNKILELLFNQKTKYLESDFEKLYTRIRRDVKQRSLLILFTNFQTQNGLKRQMHYLRKINKQHLLVVVIFKNTELAGLINKTAKSVREVYEQTIAEKFSMEKKLIVKELQAHGIHSILTEPKNLSINVINKYLELKSRAAI